MQVRVPSTTELASLLGQPAQPPLTTRGAWGLLTVPGAGTHPVRTGDSLWVLSLIWQHWGPQAA